jgi:hypothetical protein
MVPDGDIKIIGGRNVCDVNLESFNIEAIPRNPFIINMFFIDFF